MPSEPIACAQTGSKTVTDLAFHPQRRGLLLASLRAELRVEVFDVSLAPHAGGEAATVMAPWRSYDVAEEVHIAAAACACHTLLSSWSRDVCVCAGRCSLLAQPARPCSPLRAHVHDERLISLHLHPSNAAAGRQQRRLHRHCTRWCAVHAQHKQQGAGSSSTKYPCMTHSLSIAPPLCHVTCLCRPRGSSVRQARGKWAGG